MDVARALSAGGRGVGTASLSSLQPCGFELVARVGMVGGTVERWYGGGVWFGDGGVNALSLRAPRKLWLGIGCAVLTAPYQHGVGNHLA